MVKYLPIALIVLGCSLIFVGVTNPFELNSVLCAAIITFGLAELFTAIYAKRLANLEEKLSRFIYDFDSDDLPMIRCNNCGKKYDMGVEECPYCENKRLKSYINSHEEWE